MILVCPECAARYEVAALALPPEGRDVECLSCGHQWHYMPQTAAPKSPPTPAPAPLPPAASQTAATTEHDTGMPPDVLAFLREEATRRQAKATEMALAPNAQASASPDARVAAGPGTDTAAPDSAASADSLISDSAAAHPAQPIPVPVPTAVQTDPSQTTPPAPNAPQPALHAAVPLTAAPWRAAGPQAREPNSQAENAISRGWLLLAMAMILAGFVHIAAPSIGKVVPPLAPMLGSYTALVDSGLAKTSARLGLGVAKIVD